MKMERTLAIIKPDAVASGHIGEIIRRIEREGLVIVAVNMQHMDRRKAEGFYYVHKGKPFFDVLIDYMTSGPSILMVLEGEDAVPRWRRVMGATDPAKAEPGTIRRDLGHSLTKNAAHGSDSPENADYEVFYFFRGSDILEIDRDKVFASGSDD